MNRYYGNTSGRFDPDAGLGPYLIVHVEPGNASPIQPADRAGQPTHFDSGLSPINCDKVDRMLSAAREFGRVPYGYYTSNSVARYIGDAGGFHPTAPPGTTGIVGWDHQIPLNH